MQMLDQVTKYGVIFEFIFFWSLIVSKTCYYFMCIQIFFAVRASTNFSNISYFLLF